MRWKKTACFGTLAAMAMLVSQVVLAAGGGGVTEIVVVSDTRVIEWDLLLYFSDLYNTDTTVFAIWAVVLTAGYGCVLAFIMDIIMTRTGIDLKSRKLIEH